MRGSTAKVGALTWLAFVACLSAAEPVRYDLLQMMGSPHGVQPPQPMSGRYGKIIFGKPAPPLQVPDSVVADDQGRVWITDRGTRAVHMFDAARKKFKLITGSGEQDFVCPAGIDVDSLGQVYVADSGLGRIFVFDRDGRFLRFLADGRQGGLLKRPTALAVSPNRKSIYVVDAERKKLVVLNQEGEVANEWDNEVAPGTTGAIAVGGGRVFVMTGRGGGVQIFSSSGAPMGVLRWDRAQDICAFAYDAQRNRYIVGNRRYGTVMVFNEDGDLVGAMGQSGNKEEEMSEPGYLHVDAQGLVYVVDPQNAKVLVFGEPGAKERERKRDAEPPKLRRRGGDRDEDSGR